MPEPHGALFWIPWWIGIAAMLLAAFLFLLAAAWLYDKRERDLARPAPSSAPPDHTEGGPCRAGLDDLRARRILRDMGDPTDAELERIREMVFDLSHEDELTDAEIARIEDGLAEPAWYPEGEWRDGSE